MRKLTEMTPLGEYIRELREKHDVSLRELAKTLELSPAFISDIELGRRFPSEEVLADIAKALKTTIKDLEAHDLRPPIEEIKKAAASDPNYAIALRAALTFSSEDLMSMLNALPEKKRRTGT
jgi:transcriptional regulator with XRE-family HTH domain